MRASSIIMAMALALAGGAARAGELTVFTGGSMLGAMQAAGADFTKATGTHLTFVSGTTGVLSQRIKAGEKADVVVTSAEGLAPLQTAGFIEPGPTTPVANAIVGVAVKAGAPKPDISTTERFVQALHAASTISYPDPKAGATTGVFIQAMFERLRVAEEMGAKTLYQPTGAQAATAVAQGKADLVVTFISELVMEPGVTVVGPLPEALQNPIPYAAGVATTATDPAAAKAFIDFVTSSAERGRLTAAGVQPAR